MNIQTRLALDVNHNRLVEPEEVVSFESLRELDDGDAVLRGDELGDVFFEYGTDDWLPASETTYRDTDDFSMRIRVKQIRLNPPGMDLDVKISS